MGGPGAASVSSPATPGPLAVRAFGVPRDLLGRPLLDLRLSVTDCCDFRCRYCRPAGLAPPAPARPPLSFREYDRLVAAFVGLGVRKVRLTGGEPLLRPGLPELVRRLARHPGLDLALTTNGSRLAELAEPLAAAGLKRLAVSLDALDPATFAAMSGTRLDPARVLAGIAAAERAGLGPVKVNVVVSRGANEQAAVELALRFRGTGRIVRFIEQMDAGPDGAWSRDAVVSGAELLARLAVHGRIEELPRGAPEETARRFRWASGDGEIGLITSVSQPFCVECTRARVSADGTLYTCLFAGMGTDLRPALRPGAPAAELAALLRDAWAARDDRHSELSAQHRAGHGGRRMALLGG